MDRDRTSRWGDEDRGGDVAGVGNPNDSGSIAVDPKQQRDAQPDLYGIYDGSVSKVMDYGCFVELRGFPPLPNGKRLDGLVHVSQIQNGVLRDPSKAVKRGQPCKVKLISSVSTNITKKRYSLAVQLFRLTYFKYRL